ncbi:hypothetical protein [Streptosporangium sp. KLBMP 9127]|nr:hypothetical protein [Streptosporangium sp. KLBMP 9127]
MASVRVTRGWPGSSRRIAAASAAMVVGTTLAGVGGPARASAAGPRVPGGFLLYESETTRGKAGK